MPKGLIKWCLLKGEQRKAANRLQPMFSFKDEGMHWLINEKEILRRR